eukprot:TRINITY_DN17824_c0_g1_i5.p1 TRINITY_DN17824_c0_g1~~TRINITY_DN17824_c0_g1_i5.p1  ORF type:complete len:1855 (-),score=318.99 TRINITY_DN17824_c0_g1_i5:109-5673(-)
MQDELLLRTLRGLKAELLQKADQAEKRILGAAKRADEIHVRLRVATSRVGVFSQHQFVEHGIAPVTDTVVPAIDPAPERSASELDLVQRALSIGHEHVSSKQTFRAWVPLPQVIGSSDFWATATLDADARSETSSILSGSVIGSVISEEEAPPSFAAIDADINDALFGENKHSATAEHGEKKQVSFNWGGDSEEGDSAWQSEQSGSFRDDPFGLGTSPQENQAFPQPKTAPTLNFADELAARITKSQPKDNDPLFDQVSAPLSSKTPAAASGLKKPSLFDDESDFLPAPRREAKQPSLFDVDAPVSRDVGRPSTKSATKEASLFEPNPVAERDVGPLGGVPAKEASLFDSGPSARPPAKQTSLFDSDSSFVSTVGGPLGRTQSKQASLFDNDVPSTRDVGGPLGRTPAKQASLFDADEPASAKIGGPLGRTPSKQASLFDSAKSADASSHGPLGGSQKSSASASGTRGASLFDTGAPAGFDSGVSSTLRGRKDSSLFEDDIPNPPARAATAKSSSSASGPLGKASRPDPLGGGGQQSSIFGDVPRPPVGKQKVGLQTQSIFGDEQPQSASLFGDAPPKQPKSASLFENAAPQSASLFGEAPPKQPKSAAPQSASLFGEAPPKQPKSASPFEDAAPQSANLFGEAPLNQPKSASQSASLFGEAPSKQPKSAFPFEDAAPQSASFFGEAPPKQPKRASLFEDAVPQSASLFGNATAPSRTSRSKSRDGGRGSVLDAPQPRLDSDISMPGGSPSQGPELKSKSLFGDGPAQPSGRNRSLSTQRSKTRGGVSEGPDSESVFVEQPRTESNPLFASQRGSLGPLSLKSPTTSGFDDVARDDPSSAPLASANQGPKQSDNVDPLFAQQSRTSFFDDGPLGSSPPESFPNAKTESLADDPSSKSKSLFGEGSKKTAGIDPLFAQPSRTSLFGDGARGGSPPESLPNTKSGSLAGEPNLKSKSLFGDGPKQTTTIAPLFAQPSKESLFDDGASKGPSAESLENTMPRQPAARSEMKSNSLFGDGPKQNDSIDTLFAQPSKTTLFGNDSPMGESLESLMDAKSGSLAERPALQAKPFEAEPKKTASINPLFAQPSKASLFGDDAPNKTATIDSLFAQPAEASLFGGSTHESVSADLETTRGASPLQADERVKKTKSTLGDETAPPSTQPSKEPLFSRQSPSGDDSSAGVTTESLFPEGIKRSKSLFGDAVALPANLETRSEQPSKLSSLFGDNVGDRSTTSFPSAPSESPFSEDRQVRPTSPFPTRKAPMTTFDVSSPPTRGLVFDDGASESAEVAVSLGQTSRFEDKAAKSASSASLFAQPSKADVFGDSGLQASTSEPFVGTGPDVKQTPPLNAGPLFGSGLKQDAKMPLGDGLMLADTVNPLSTQQSKTSLFRGDDPGGTSLFSAGTDAIGGVGGDDLFSDTRTVGSTVATSKLSSNPVHPNTLFGEKADASASGVPPAVVPSVRRSWSRSSSMSRSSDDSIAPALKVHALVGEESYMKPELRNANEVLEPSHLASRLHQPSSASLFGSDGAIPRTAVGDGGALFNSQPLFGVGPEKPSSLFDPTQTAKSSLFGEMTNAGASGSVANTNSAAPSSTTANPSLALFGHDTRGIESIETKVEPFERADQATLSANPSKPPSSKTSAQEISAGGKQAVAQSLFQPSTQDSLFPSSKSANMASLFGEDDLTSGPGVALARKAPSKVGSLFNGDETLDDGLGLGGQSEKAAGSSVPSAMFGAQKSMPPNVSMSASPLGRGTGDKIKTPINDSVSNERNVDPLNALFGTSSRSSVSGPSSSRQPLDPLGAVADASPSVKVSDRGQGTRASLAAASASLFDDDPLAEKKTPLDRSKSNPLAKASLFD